MTKSQDDLPRLSTTESEQLASHLADLTRSGKPLVEGLRAAADEAGAGRLARALWAIAHRLEKGQSLDDVLSLASTRLPRYVGNVVGAAVQSGKFAEVLMHLVEHQRSTRRLRRSVGAALAYPGFVLLLTFGVFVFTHVFIVGQFEQIFHEFELTLPAVTVSLIWWGSTGMWMILALVGIAVGAALLIRVIGGAARFRRAWATVPLLGSLSHWSAVADWSRMISILVQQGIPLPTVLRLAADGTYDASISQVSRGLAEGAEQGRDLSKMLAADYRLPAMMAPIIQSGQQNGTLAEAFATASQMYESRVRLRSSVLRSVLPPIVFILVGTFVGLIFTGIFAPLIAMLQGISGF